MVEIKQQVRTEQYVLYQGDCCEVLKEVASESIHLAIFSPPFPTMYCYSDHPADMGNSKSYEGFFIHFGFLVEQLQRVMVPGRIIAVHCMDLPTYKNSGEEIGLRDFPGDLVRAFQKEDFIFHSRFCIWKDPLVAATRTKAIGLAHKQIIKDSSMCRTGIPDYILAFRKKGENPKPISHKKGFTAYYGSRQVPKHFDSFLISNGEYEGGKDRRSQWIWQQVASPVWFDIRQTRTLQYRQGKDTNDEKHIAPLQLDVVERCLQLWSTKGDIVLSPFAGIGTEIFVAVKGGRKAIGIELKTSYFRQMKRNMASLEQRKEISDEDE